MSIIITAFRHTISVTKTSSNTYTVIETLEENPLHDTAFSVTCTSMEDLLNLLDAYFQEKARRYQGGCGWSAMVLKRDTHPSVPSLETLLSGLDTCLRSAFTREVRLSDLLSEVDNCLCLALDNADQHCLNSHLYVLRQIMNSDDLLLILRSDGQLKDAVADCTALRGIYSNRFDQLVTVLNTCGLTMDRHNQYCKLTLSPENRVILTITE